MATRCTPDFHGYDWNSSDFYTSSFSIRFSTYIFSLFSRYFLENDTYKDSNDKGLLERYMSVFGHELDMEIVPYLGCYLDIIDAQICEEKYLIHISDVLGNPPDIFKDETIYRNLLSYVISIYKIKGTIGAYELFFSILGFGVVIEELPILNNESVYDNPEGIYDQSEYLALYDQSKCQTCSFYDVNFFFLSDTGSVIDISTINKLRSVIYFNEPINAKLRNFTSKIVISDTMSINISDSDEVQIETVDRYDEESLYDDGNEYDDIFTIGGSPISVMVNINGAFISPTVPHITLLIEDNFSPATLDVVNTFVTSKYYNASSELLYEKNGPLEDVEIDGTEITATIIDGELSTSTLSYVEIKIRMLLSDGRLGYLNKTVAANTNTITQIYLI